MKGKINYMLAAILTCIAFKSFSQEQHKIDSLKTLLQSSGEDTNKAIILYRLSKAYWDNNADTALKYAQHSLELSEKINYKKGIVNAYNSIGVIDYYKEDYLSGLEILRKALLLSKKINYQNGLAYAYGNMGMIYSNKSDYNQALENYFSALKIYELMEDKKGIAFSYNNIGNVYLDENNLKEALKYHSASLKIKLETGEKKSTATSYNNIGIIYLNLGNDSMALINHLNSLKIRTEIGDVYGIAQSQSNIGNIYINQGKYQKAIESLFAAKKIAENMSDKYLMSLCYNFLGLCYTKLKNYEEASVFLHKSLDIAIGIKSLLSLKDNYERLSELDSAVATLISTPVEKRKEFAMQALANYKLFIIYRDSITNMEKIKKTLQLQMQYDFDKKELQQKAEQNKKDAIAATQLKNQTIIRNYSLAGLGLASLVILLLFNQYRVTKKSNKLIAQQKQIAEEQRTRAEESEKFKSRFLANMSHEIRTPMNAVMGMTNLVLNSKLDTQQHKYLDAVQKSSRNLLVIINDILDLSKIEAGKMELEKIDFRLHDTIDTVYNTLRFRAEEKGLKFNVTIDKNVPIVLIGDPVRLNQVLINLLGNAIKFTPRGKVNLNISNKGEVQSSPDQIGINLQFSISDTGIGIPQDKISKVFEGFQQADKETFRKFGGTGLGLNISKQLTEMMGGTIVAESEHGKGTTFTLTIPFAIGSEDALNIPPQKMDESLLKTLSKLHILLAEDNEFNQIVAKDTLQMIIPGITVDIANNGEEAVAKIKNQNYDLILMDINMPEMNGLEAARIIRRMPPPLNNIYIIAMTASVTKDEIASCYEAGMNDYVPKPFEQNELVEKIAKVKAA